MNERIKELAEQSGLSKARYWIDMQHVLHFEKLVSRQDDHTEEVKKFADFIVRECLDIVYNADTTELEGPDPEDMLYIVAKQIKKHFEVEE